MEAKDHDPIDWLLKKLQEVDPAAGWRRLPWPFRYQLDTQSEECLVQEVNCFPSQGMWLYGSWDLRTKPPTFIQKEFSSPEDVVQYVSLLQK